MIRLHIYYNLLQLLGVQIYQTTTLSSNLFPQLARLLYLLSNDSWDRLHQFFNSLSLYGHKGFNMVN